MAGKRSPQDSAPAASPEEKTAPVRITRVERPQAEEKAVPVVITRKAAEEDSAEDSAPAPFTEEQYKRIHNLLRNGGGVTYDQISVAVFGAPEEAHGRLVLSSITTNKRDPLEEYLMDLIARGDVKRVWNREQEDHFYFWMS